MRGSCIECGSKARHELSYLCEKCFEEKLKAKLDDEAS